MQAPTKRAAILSAVVATAAVLAQSTAAETASVLKTPNASEIALVPPNVAVTTLKPEARARLAAASFWGGTYTASTGDQVTLYLSETYPQDQATAQRWVEFFAHLVHGSELSRLSPYLMPLAEVQSYCGRQALACYSPGRSMLVAPGENPFADTSAEGVIAHEYGHHVASFRSNAPWTAVDTGTKRWASYIQVCSRTQRGELFPGAESLPNYRLNPGEGFAEVYRLLNERRLGLAESPWGVVSNALLPDDTALSLVEQDVLQPWTGTTATKFSGTRNHSYSVATPLDGTLTVRLTAAGKKTRYRVDVLLGSRRVVRKTGASVAAPTTICGQRTAQIRLTRTAGTGGYALTVIKP